MFYNLFTKCHDLNHTSLRTTERCGFGVRKLLAFTWGVTRPDQFVIIAIAFYWSFLVAFVPGTPQVLCWGEGGGPRSRQRLLLDQDQRQRTAGLLWHAKLRWVLDHRSSSDWGQLHPIEPRFNTIQHYSNQLNTIEPRLDTIQHNSTLFKSTQHNWTTTQHNPTLFNTIQSNSTQLNHDSTQSNTIELNSTEVYVFPKH